jgi:hypothetical protein
MSKKVLALSIILLLTTISLASISFVKAAGDAEWITDYTVTDADTGSILVQYDAAANQTTRLGAVVPNTDIKITFTVNVIASGEGDLKLTSGLGKPSSGSYWEYDGAYDLGSKFSPNTASTNFNWVAGEFEITLYGRVPSTASASKAITAVTLAGPSGTSLDTLKITATSAAMDNFLTLFDQKNDVIQSLKASGVDASYIQLCESVLAGAQDVANGGDVENAIALLDGIDTANAPAGSLMQTLFIPIIGGTAAVAVIFVVLFFRARGKVSYFQLVVEDQIKDLEGLTLRAAKIDRAMSASLDSVKDRLKRLVGM